MAADMKIQLSIGQRLTLTPMLQQVIKLLPMTRLELIQAIRTELEENPLLEEVEPLDGEDTRHEIDEAEVQANRDPPTDPQLIDTLDRQDNSLASTLDNAQPYEEDSAFDSERAADAAKKDEIDWDAYLRDDVYDGGGSGEIYNERAAIENRLWRKEDLRAFLLPQLDISAVLPEEKEIGSIIIGNLNTKGYLDGDIDSIAELTGYDHDKIEDALALVQSFEPAGVGARDLRESLLLQARAAGYRGALVEELIAEHLDELDERNFPKLARKLDCKPQDVALAARVIREFDPAPGLKYSANQIDYITPDLYVVKVDNDYQVYLNDDGIPRLSINPVYRQALRKSNAKTAQAKETFEFLNAKYKSALWMINSIEQRRRTMLKVGASLTRFQRPFLDNGIDHLRGLILKDVADDIGMSESTISRVTTNKYIQTPQGLYELKFFFHSSIPSTGATGAMSSVRVKSMIKDMLKGENSARPLTDGEIVDGLKRRGLDIARRTVTKYRKEMKIARASKRREVS